MLENIIKGIELILSAKSVTKVVVGCATYVTTLYFLNQRIVKTSTDIGLSSEIAHLLIVILTFGIGALLIDFLVWSAKKFRAGWSRFKRNTKEYGQIKEIERHFSEVLLHLKPSELSVLRRFKDNYIELVRQDPSVVSLESYGFIQRRALTSSYYGLYQLTPELAPLVKPYLSEYNYKRLKTHILHNLTSEEREFLLLFGTSKPDDSNEFEHPRLKFTVYRSAYSLDSAGVLTITTNNKNRECREDWVQLTAESIPLIEEHVLRGKIQRDSITINHNNVDASGCGGSGAPVFSRLL